MWCKFHIDRTTGKRVLKLIIKSVALHVWYAKPKIPPNKWMPGLLLILMALYFILTWNKTTTQKRHHQELDQQRSPHPKPQPQNTKVNGLKTGTIHPGCRVQELVMNFWKGNAHIPLPF